MGEVRLRAVADPLVRDTKSAMGKQTAGRGMLVTCLCFNTGSVFGAFSALIRLKREPPNARERKFPRRGEGFTM